MNQEVIFANVDLEMECAESLQTLIEELGPDMNVQFHDRLDSGNDFASLSLRNADSGIYGEPDRTISAFCDRIETVSLESRRIWDLCAKREFDIGFESGIKGKTFMSKLDHSTIKRVADLGATIEITIYPFVKE